MLLFSSELAGLQLKHSGQLQVHTSGKMWLSSGGPEENKETKALEDVNYEAKLQKWEC